MLIVHKGMVCVRNHRTIKTAVAQLGSLAEEAACWYNVSTGAKNTSPFVWIFGAKPRLPGASSSCEYTAHPVEMPHVYTCSEATKNPYKVYLQCSSCCDVPWSGPHRVTEVKSAVVVELDDGVTCHLKRVPIR